MRVLVVASGNGSFISPFVKEQVKAVSKKGIEIHYFLIEGKGIAGYLKNYVKLKSAIKANTPDIIHAHYGLSGLVANLQRKVPVIVTYHGSDINLPKNLFFSKISMLLARQNIFVSKRLKNKAKFHKSLVIPCGIDFDMFKLMDKNESRKKMGLSSDKKYILFSSRFDNTVKNYPLAKIALEKLNITNIELIELKGYAREEVVCLMNAADLALLTSFSEGSPQFIKEAMACNLPIVTTNVGDIKEVIHATDGCYICTFDADDVAEKLKMALDFSKRTMGREKVKNFDNDLIASEIVNVYKRVLQVYE